MDWSNVIAKRALEWEDGPDGGAVLLIPRFRKGLLAKWVQPKLKRPHHRLKLDEIGTFVWRQIDGVKTFSVIAEEMKSHFGEKAEPVAQRLEKFFTILHRNKFAQLLSPQP